MNTITPADAMLAGKAPHIELRGISRRFGTTPAVADIDLDIYEGEMVALLGPSGSGKTTLLRILAGLQMPEHGAIRIAGEDALPIPPNRRRTGFVFQNYALFRHMTVARNIAFGLEIRPSGARPTQAAIRQRVEELLELVQLPGHGARYPRQLSGGQQQRVALARALAIEPRILLLDEPFGALDTKVRGELRLWLKGLHRRLGITAVLVTHDQEEAMELADRIVVMRSGRIEQAGAPEDVYAAPRNAFVYDFLGEANSLPCMVAAGEIRIGGCRLDHRTTRCAEPLDDGPARAWFRPEDMEIAISEAETMLSATVADVTAVGSNARLHLTSLGQSIMAKLPANMVRPLALGVGSSLWWRPLATQIYREG